MLVIADDDWSEAAALLVLLLLAEGSLWDTASCELCVEGATRVMHTHVSSSVVQASAATG